MKKRHLLPLGLALALATAALVPRPAAAQDYQEGYTFGVGGVLGQPLGLSLDFLLGAGHTIQVDFGFDLWFHDGFVTFANWAWHPMIVFSNSVIDMSFHVGAGLFLNFWYNDHSAFLCYWDHGVRHCHDDDGVAFGALFPGGLDVFFKGAPVEVFLELAPGFWFVPFVDFWMYGGVGGRYYF